MWACGPIAVPRMRLPFAQVVEPSKEAESLESFDRNNCDARKQNKPTWTITLRAVVQVGLLFNGPPGCCRDALHLVFRQVNCTDNLRAGQLYCMKMRDRTSPRHRLQRPMRCLPVIAADFDQSRDGPPDQLVHGDLWTSRGLRLKWPIQILPRTWPELKKIDIRRHGCPPRTIRQAA